MNKESRKFIKYAQDKMKYQYDELFENAVDTLLAYYQNTNRDLFRFKVTKKLEQAAKEYGSPLDNTYDVDKELEAEIIDLVVGWPLVREYKEKHD